MTYEESIEHLSTAFYEAPETLSPKFCSVLRDIERGTPIIVVDDYERENEGDLMIAGEQATIETIAFMARRGRGIMCLPTEGWLLDSLKIPLMVPSELATDPYQTAFTISVDAKEGISTGVSASDRMRTINVMLDPLAEPSELARPGHMFPLRARDGLLADRRGHTEASITLMKILEYYPLAVISEIMNDDGSMARLPELEVLANQFNLQILSIEDIVKELKLNG